VTVFSLDPNLKAFFSSGGLVLSGKTLSLPVTIVLEVKSYLREAVIQDIFENEKRPTKCEIYDAANSKITQMQR